MVRAKPCCSVKFEKMTKIRGKKSGGIQFFLWEFPDFLTNSKKKSGGIQNFVDSLIEIFKSLGGWRCQKSANIHMLKKVQIVRGGGWNYIWNCHQFYKRNPFKKCWMVSKIWGKHPRKSCTIWWLDGWMVGWLDGWMVQKFSSTLRIEVDPRPELREDKPRSARK